MRFSVSAFRDTATGLISATLYADSEVVATRTNFKDTNSVDKWAKGVAQDHKRENLPEAQRSLSYSHSFSL